MLGVDLVADLRRIDLRIKTLDGEIARTVRRYGTCLTELFGVGEVLAAKIIAHTGRVDRFADRHHYASYTGTAPIEASSGEITRHRLSRAGNRQLNHAPHLMAICQIRHNTDGRRY
jgi:transposase